MNTTNPEPDEQAEYLSVPKRTLYDVCHSLGRDDAGRACALCPVRDLCASQEAKRAAAAAA